MRVACAFALVLLCSCGERPNGALHIDSSIAAELKQVRAIDNHAHPQKVVSAGEVDRDFDALPADAIEEPALPTPFREGSPYFPKAWHALFQYPFSDNAPDHLKVLRQERQDMMREKGDLYPSWVLNRAQTDIMLANRVAMGRGLSPDRFKWVPFADMFLFPLNNNSIKAEDPEHRSFLQNEERLLNGYLRTANLARLPATLDDYLRFLSHQLENWKSQGAVALKFELAYLRDLAISNPQKENAERIYAIYAQSSEPTPEEYKILQDYLFRYIAHEAGRMELPVHIHSSIGVGSYFHDQNANPFQLESIFNDPALRRTKFVLLHGAWPFAREAAASILKPNVYLDYSGFMYWTYPVEAARALRLYLEAAPEKVLYGTDGSPFSQNIGWEDTTWIGAQTGRQALGLALTGMLEDHEITPQHAIQLVHMVLRENARTLYRF